MINNPMVYPDKYPDETVEEIIEKAHQAQINCLRAGEGKDVTSN